MSASVTYTLFCGDVDSIQNNLAYCLHTYSPITPLNVECFCRELSNGEKSPLVRSCPVTHPLQSSIIAIWFGDKKKKHETIQCCLRSISQFYVFLKLDQWQALPWTFLSAQLNLFMLIHLWLFKPIHHSWTSSRMVCQALCQGDTFSLLLLCCLGSLGSTGTTSASHFGVIQHFTSLFHKSAFPHIGLLKISG